MTMRNCCVGAALLAVSAAAMAATPAPSFTSIEIPLPAKATTAVGVGINSHGDVAGVSVQSGGDPFVYYHATGAEVILNGFGAGGINDSDHVAGTIVNPVPQAVLWSKNGGVEILPTGGTFSEASAVANNGDVAGNVDNGHGEDRAVMWSARPTLHLTSIPLLWSNPVLPSEDSNAALAINNLSHVAGSSQFGTGTTPDTAHALGTHAYLYRNGKVLDLGALALATDGSDFSEARGLNNLDQVVGNSTTAFALPCADCGKARHAFLWSAGKMRDLGTLANISSWESTADSINDSGEVVGWSDSNVNGSAVHRAFLYSGGQLLNLQFFVNNRDPNVRLTEAVGINCQGWIVANGFNTATPNISRIYLLVRRGAPRAQCAK